MQVKFEFVSYDDDLKTFTLDENVYTLELNAEQVKTYELLKEVELHLYNWFKEADFFHDWLREEVYPNSIGKKIAICDIADTSFRRFYFFKLTSGDIHYEYFKNLFGLIEETDWQDREYVGKEILDRLFVKRNELVIEMKEKVDLKDDNEA